MEAVTLSFMGYFVGMGLLLIALSAPLIRRRVKPNRWYGFRTAKTLSDERIWYDANAYAGRKLSFAGVVFIVAAVAFYFVLRPNFAAYNTACTVALLSALTIDLWLCFRYLRSL
jgi:uncharacterized membrane protein